MTKIELIKSAVGLTTGFGVSQIIASAVNATTQPENAFQTVTVYAGRVGIAMIVADAVQKHTDAKIDAIAEWWKINITEATAS